MRHCRYFGKRDLSPNRKAMPKRYFKPPRGQVSRLHAFAEQKGFTVELAVMTDCFHLIDSSGAKAKRPDNGSVNFSAAQAIEFLKGLAAP